MSDEAPEQESKTEDPSHRKLEEAHKKGDVAKSQEVTAWFMLVGMAVVVSSMAPWVAQQISNPLQIIMMNADRFDVEGSGFSAFFNGLALAMIGAVLAPLGVLYVCGVVANLIQHKPLFSTEPVTPKFSKISPLAGAKRLFSGEALVNFGKGLAKIAVVGTVVVMTVWPERDRLDTMMTADPIVILLDFQELAVKILTSVLIVVTAIAAADYFYTRNKWWKRQMMTMQETRDEYKQMEGDPHVKGRIRQLRQEKARKRMMQAVPDATVVVTNPTHYAVALKYEKGMGAPKCVAKGADAVALRIRTVAKESDVPIIENPPLARALYASVDVDQDIPAEHFKAVAEIIGFVMRLKHGQSWKAR
ncbi:flagellar biosynthesis protein FlhB [Devosia sp. BK]|jgi:flagellar biosynthetic protein FlhB|uniref:flagellar biosynthesis protein FlhB n=1 Tax=unclassified Devosia TaxID=196773 RepID=UPI0007156BB3|nr:MULTISPECIES: flagellar biosynthesis protein FlhB [unclassified Devosia]KQN74256.1 flagellar biosynthetic protein FlhB [Devosia sp. Leaf64]MDV3250489.1 flagellar biosynthesis protein FlhB [Devosia sp. BK]